MTLDVLRAAAVLVLLTVSVDLPGRPPAAAPPARGAAEHEAEHGAPAAGPGRVPESMRIEHAELHEALAAAARRPGPVGDAARQLVTVLHPHFVREEEIALPPLGLLVPLSKGPPTADMKPVLRLTDALAAELPRMLEEHRRIAAAARRLEQVAREQKDAAVAETARKLQLHARTEEEVTYPAAVLVGKVVHGAP